MATTLLGPRGWSMSRDEEGHREYKIKWLVKAERTDGPANVVTTLGIALPGATWSLFDDVDIWAWCRPNAEVRLLREEDGLYFWEVEQTFSTKPLKFDRGRDWNGSQNPHNTVGDPLLEPMKISGSFTNKSEEAVLDRFGNQLVNSAHEQIRGPAVEFDHSSPTVKIEQNVLLLELPLIALMRDTVNDRQMWGIPRRCIKLTNISWDRKPHPAYRFYYTRSFEFTIDIRFKYDVTDPFNVTGANRYIASGFDRDILDEGNKALNGYLHPTTKEWILVDVNGEPPDPSNHLHFVRYQDPNGNTSKVILDGLGKPWKASPETVTGCSQCVTRAPKYWQVTGFFNAGFDNGTRYNIVLTHSAGCTWSGNTADGGDTITLSYDEGQDQWSLTITDTLGDLPDRKWVLDGGDWSCMGVNSMPRDEDNPILIGPDHVGLIPVPGNRAGIRHVEYYNESNFFLLGIPTDL